MDLQAHLLEHVNDDLLFINDRDILATPDNISMHVHCITADFAYAIDLLSEIKEELENNEEN